MNSIDQNAGVAADALNDELFPNGISLDSFDEPDEPHEFSATYQARKAALLSEYRASQVEAARNGQPPATIALPKAQVRRKRAWGWKAAVAAAAAALVALPAAGFAVASSTDFFANAFGTAARDSVAAHEVTRDQGGKVVTTTFPAREYVDIDPEEAEALLGDYLMTTPVELQMGDHEVTVLSAVRDHNSAVVHYTVSREGGVAALAWDEFSNETKGAQFAEDAPWYWELASRSADGDVMVAGSHVFVNPTRSSADVLDCYEYAAFIDPASSDDIGLQMVERTTGDASFAALNWKDPLPAATFTAADGASVHVTPLSMHIDDGLSVTALDGEGLPSYLKTASIRFNDGTVYTVLDNDGNIDNTAYGCSLEGNSWFTEVFNRLVNPESIDSITVNGVEFTR